MVVVIITIPLRTVGPHGKNLAWAQPMGCGVSVSTYMQSLRPLIYRLTQRLSSLILDLSPSR